MSLFSSIMDLLFPPKCAFCWKVLDGEGHVCCTKCAANLPYTTGGGWQTGEYFDLCVAPLYFDGAVRNSIHRYKFSGAQGYAGAYGKLLAGCVSEHLPEFDIITWAPLSRERLRRRGYDQAFLLASAAASELGRAKPVETLKKTADTKAQSELGGKRERGLNVTGAYEAADTQIIRGKCVLIIDDVVTTGATLDECARVLREAGAGRVICAALACTPLTAVNN